MNETNHPNDSSTLTRLTGRVARITFVNEKTDYTIAQINPSGSGDVVTVVGTRVS